MFEKLPDNLYKIILTGECRTVEFKEAKKNLPNSLFETICSMLNRNGGHIFLGVKDNGNIIGINKEQINLMKKEFANLCNNPMKLFPTVYLDIKEYTYDEKHILYILAKPTKVSVAFLLLAHASTVSSEVSTVEIILTFPIALLVKLLVNACTLKLKLLILINLYISFLTYYFSPYIISPNLSKDSVTFRFALIPKYPFSK